MVQQASPRQAYCDLKKAIWWGGKLAPSEAIKDRSPVRINVVALF